MEDPAHPFVDIAPAGPRGRLSGQARSDGIEIHIAYDGAAVMTRVFDTGDEALAWATKTRAERKARGWQEI